MDFEAYLAQLPTPKPLSEVKLKILRRLWHQDMVPFPKPWVSSSELLELTQQSYFDRRARELRELGCDIESHYHEAFKEHAWRLNSSQLSTPKHRDYLTKSQKQHLFEQHNFTCAICGQSATPGLRGLQADHKRPLSRGGTLTFRIGNHSALIATSANVALAKVVSCLVKIVPGPFLRRSGFHC
jgi:5-methylcytosine-specific restriction endonuclease McrA